MRNPLELLAVESPNDTEVKYTNYTDHNSLTILRDDGTFENACKSYKTINDMLRTTSEDYLKHHMPGIGPYLRNQRTRQQRDTCSTPSNAFQCLALDAIRETLRPTSHFCSATIFIAIATTKLL